LKKGGRGDFSWAGVKHIWFMDVYPAPAPAGSLKRRYVVKRPPYFLRPASEESLSSGKKRVDTEFGLE
jgi:hypothetical protein